MRSRFIATTHSNRRKTSSAPGAPSANWELIFRRTHSVTTARTAAFILLVIILSLTLGQGCTEAQSTPAALAASAPTATASVRVQPAQGIWLSPQEIAALPTTGRAWEQLVQAADQPVGPPNLSDQDSLVNTTILAKALVFARTQKAHYRAEVITALTALIIEKSEEKGRTLALGRELVAYVIAADLINLRAYDPALNQRFEERLYELLTKPIGAWGTEPKSLRNTHETRPNNWGSHAGASRAAIAFYLQDEQELQRTAQVFQGYLGDRALYNRFEYGSDLSWQIDPERPVAVNPPGAQKEGYSIDGALPEEMRRGGRFQWPPKKTNYAWGALQGALVQAAILDRAGYPAWEWQDRALLRAVKFLYQINWKPKGDDQWMVWLINAAYGTEYPTAQEVAPGKNMGWTNWTHAKP